MITDDAVEEVLGPLPNTVTIDVNVWVVGTLFVVVRLLTSSNSSLKPVNSSSTFVILEAGPCMISIHIVPKVFVSDVTFQ